MYNHKPESLLQNVKYLRFGDTAKSSIVETLLKMYSADVPKSKIDPSEQCIVHDLERQRHIKKFFDVSNVYRVTLQGKCKILCHNLDVRFLGLCILAEAYVISRSQEQNGCGRSYAWSDIMEYFDSVYRPKTIQNIVYELCSRGFASGISKKVIRLSDDIMSELSQYHDVMYELHEWITSIPKQLYVMTHKDPAGLDELKNK